MRAASTYVDITPHGAFYMEGYIHPCRKSPALGVHDAPLAVLLLLEVDGEEILFASLDVCIVSAEATEPMRRGLSEVLDLDPSRIVISAIHSHSCASGFEGTESSMGIPATAGYVSMVTGRVIEAATLLKESMAEVGAEVLSTRVQGWYSNRNDAHRPFNDEAMVLRFRDGEGGIVAAMLNFNCHATVVGPTNRLLTSDVLGGVRAELSEWIGVIPYTFTGASGDLGNRQYRRGNDFAELRRVSNGIAGEIMKGVFEAIDLERPRASSFSQRIQYDNAQFHDGYRRQLDAVLDVLRGDPTPDEKKLADTEKEMLELQLERRELDFTVSMTTIDFGPLAFVTFPGELASDLGLMALSSFKTKKAYIIGYANDYQGYFVPADDFGGTSYESYVTKMPRGWAERMLEAYGESL